MESDTEDSVYVPGILACSVHVEKGDVGAVSVGVEQPSRDNGWAIAITHGIVLQGLKTGITTMSKVGIFCGLSSIGVDMTDRIHKREERILDMYAALGGKTTTIASLMKDKGEVIAVDRSHNKVLEIHNLAAELGLNSIKEYKLDALKAVYETNTNGAGVKVGQSQTSQESRVAIKVKLRKENKEERLQMGPGEINRLVAGWINVKDFLQIVVTVSFLSVSPMMMVAMFICVDSELLLLLDLVSVGTNMDVIFGG
ncbi:hypothetical protein L2E82_05101 [Cichorium intybus]|uniref:Uncharacterized protein n=1 Tax=Cichorium intybus TaxID=13427 RepID=A0ACB9H8Q9_CICIN|nr:hypothetical protein L2E82_05101 [Cichorium intybus]